MASLLDEKAVGTARQRAAKLESPPRRVSEHLCWCSHHSNWSSRSMIDDVQVLKEVGK